MSVTIEENSGGTLNVSVECQTCGHKENLTIAHGDSMSTGKCPKCGGTSMRTRIGGMSIRQTGSGNRVKIGKVG